VLRPVDVQSDKGKGKVIGIDLLEIEPIIGVDFTVMDFLEADAPEKLKVMLGGEADIVMSDMAANTTGHKKTDHLKIVALAELAAEFAREVLAPGGAFLAKVLHGDLAFGSQAGFCASQTLQTRREPV
jgi:23S rRNA (uridine2552-2'-O)-methyltransferase